MSNVRTKPAGSGPATPDPAVIEIARALARMMARVDHAREEAERQGR
ncbi:hypothetical protein [Aureimonas sp. SK2]|nr:hypothetical protein [Aureimonas sp. SK2]